MSDAAPSLWPDPSERLNAAFGAIAQRMQGLGVVNPALEVEAVDFGPWQGQWLGVMVAPWFMNLVLLPHDLRRWQPLPVGGKRKLRFPAGLYEFIGADDATIGEHQTCSLFSPMQQFETHAAARLVARLAREALFDPAHADAPEVPAANLSPLEGADAPDANGPRAAVSKRDFMRGRVTGSDDADRR